MFKGQNQGVNHYVDSPAYRAKPYPDQAWDQAIALGMNCIQFGGGQEGNVLHCQLNENHPYGRAYDSDWASSLEAFLAKAASYGIKVVFHSMGSYYGTNLGFVPPMHNYSTNAPDGNPWKYQSLAELEVLLNKLAGNNSLGKNFLTDSRIAWWSPINEARMNLGYVKDWTVGMLRMLKERGAKTSVCVNDGAHHYWETFPYIIPIIGDYIDYLQAHDYQSDLVIVPTRNDPTADLYTLSYNAFLDHLTVMADGRGGFPLDHVMLTETGMGHRSNGLPWHYHREGDFWQTKQQQADYIKGCFDAAKTVGLTNIFYHETIWMRPYPTDTTWGFGFVNYDGSMTNQLAYDVYKAATLEPVVPLPLPFHDDFVDLSKWTQLKGIWGIV